MKGINIDSMSIDELSTLEDAIRETLAARIADQTSILSDDGTESLFLELALRQ